MSQETKVKKEQVQAVEDGMQEKAFSQEFLSAMIDYAYNTLDDYLKTQDIDPKARELLGALVQLHSTREIYKETPMVKWIWNEEAGHCVGVISQLVPKLGGHFIAPSGIVLK